MRDLLDREITTETALGVAGGTLYVSRLKDGSGQSVLLEFCSGAVLGLGDSPPGAAYLDVLDRVAGELEALGHDQVARSVRVAADEGRRDARYFGGR